MIDLAFCLGAADFIFAGRLIILLFTLCMPQREFKFQIQFIKLKIKKKRK